jgi:hypothetical protein
MVEAVREQDLVREVLVVFLGLLNADGCGLA